MSAAITQAAGRELARQWVNDVRAIVTQLGDRLAHLPSCEALQGFTPEDCAVLAAQLEIAKHATEQAMYRAGARTLELSPEDKAEALDAIARN